MIIAQTKLKSEADEQKSASKRKFVILIPAYEPNSALTEVADGILAALSRHEDFAGVLVINDGSKSPGAEQVFSEIAQRSQVDVYSCGDNRGKGGALKFGFDLILSNYPDVEYVITADADGQHSPADIVMLAGKATETGKANIGYREFDREVPVRSRLGNILTASLFGLVSGKKIHDTQSGLRTYLRPQLPALLKVEANGYEFEFHALFYLVKNPYSELEQYPIQTIYEEGNPTSHFSPILDSAKIYLVFLRYVSVSAVSGALEFTLFSIMALFNVPTLTALIATRLATAPVYFFGMRNVAFRSVGNIPLQMLETALLMVIHIMFLWRFIDLLETHFHVHPIGAMLAGLFVFYGLNFLAQRYIIYPKSSSR